MSDVTVTVYGSDIVSRHLAALEEKAQEKVQAILEEAGKRALQRAQELVPVRTGFLRSQLSVEVKDFMVTLSDAAPYARFVELGTSRQAPQPYIVPAWLETNAWIKEQFRGFLEGIL